MGAEEAAGGGDRDREVDLGPIVALLERRLRARRRALRLDALATQLAVAVSAANHRPAGWLAGWLRAGWLAG